ncbi:hypothetical protein Q5762_22870 [Streptomyces sp. P9(2023)]|uniref:hypothetical protein n=1 Tax=Streptomyces sp. P9(2023) TaxID=3064394 RepID=UPI0028F439E8|nr:hypothetical protein [Streptomyces sp. P9(2023)]MDT9691139.1 hypothetical protein [Streptomyces sp. P9(2023)]
MTVGGLAAMMLSMGTASAAPVDPIDPQPEAEYCQPGNRVAIPTNTANTLDVKYRTSVTNGTSSTQNFKFTSKKGGTTTFGVSITVSAELKAGIFSKIGAEVNGSVEKSMTAEIGEEVSGTVKPHSTLKGDFGNWRENVSGWTAYQYSNCSYGTKTYFNAWAPYRTNWKVYY